MKTCPDCGGGGGARAFVDYADGTGRCEWISCRLCSATGEITDRRYAIHAAGRKVRAARVERGEGLRECARRLGISGAHLSQIERGLAEPVEGMTDQSEHEALRLEVEELRRAIATVRDKALEEAENELRRRAREWELAGRGWDTGEWRAAALVIAEMRRRKL